MKYQAVFKRYEIKYLISIEQKEKILAAMKPYMSIDEYGRTTIRNIYFDTDDYVLARRSVAKPDFKEKLRIRSYKKASADSTVYVELNRKFDGVVYKRRVGLTEHEAIDWIEGANTHHICSSSQQISEEVDYFLETYKGIMPAAFLSYEREAYRMNDGSDFRVTFDDNILCRDYDISLESDIYGDSLLPKDKVLMEIKCSGGIPMWMTEALSENRIYKTSFSKYGMAYQELIYPSLSNSAPGYALAAEQNRTSRHYAAGQGISRNFPGFGRRRATA